MLISYSETATSGRQKRPRRGREGYTGMIFTSTRQRSAAPGPAPQLQERADFPRDFTSSPGQI